MPSIWPAFAALVAVVALSLGMVVVDLVVDRETATRTGDLVDSALRSVALADRVRKDSHVLATSRLPVRRANAAAQLAFDIRQLDPLVISAEERSEWARLRPLLANLQRSRASDVPHDIYDIELGLDHIVEINRVDAVRAVTLIQRTDTHGIAIDVAGGVITLILAGGVALWLRGAFGRERELLRAHLDALEARRRELEAFAGRVAHDLRGPLAPLRGYSDLLAESSPASRAIAGRIRHATERMSAIIEGLLSLSVSGHPGGGESEVARVVQEVVQELELGDTRVELALDDATARCSAAVLHQLIDNLVTNALKYRSPARPLQLAISCARNDDSVDVAVTDNGIGMDPETAAHAFEPLYRANSVATVPGHGLGLAIVKRTVDALGGTCALASKVDRGTRVTLRLPAARRTAPAARPS